MGDRPLALRAVAPFALLVALASLLGRGLSPSAVGSVRWGDQILLVDGVVAQVVALTSTGLLGALLVSASNTHRAVVLRIVVVVLGGLCLLVGLSAAGVHRVPPLALAVVAITSALGAIVTALSGERRLPEAALGLAGVAVLARLLAVQLTLTGSAHAGVTVATVGFLLEVGALAAGSAFVLRARLRGAVALAIATLAAAATGWIVVAQPEASLLVVLRHTVERLAPRPHPLGPEVMAPMIATFSLVLAVGLGFARRADRALVGSLALVLLVRGQADVPLLGIALAVASSALFLTRGSSPVERPVRPQKDASSRLAADRGVG